MDYVVCQICYDFNLVFSLLKSYLDTKLTKLFLVLTLRWMDCFPNLSPAHTILFEFQIFRRKLKDIKQSIWKINKLHNHLWVDVTFFYFSKINGNPPVSKLSRRSLSTCPSSVLFHHPHDTPKYPPWTSCVCVLTCVQLFVNPWTVAHQVPPWNSPGENTGVGCHFLLQAIFLTQGLNPSLLSPIKPNVPCTGRQILDHCLPGKPPWTSMSLKGSSVWFLCPRDHNIHIWRINVATVSHRQREFCCLSVTLRQQMWLVCFTQYCSVLIPTEGLRRRSLVEFALCSGFVFSE